MAEVVHYVKNYGMGFFIPYTLKGEEKNYYPDCLVHARVPSARKKVGHMSTEALAQTGGEGEMVNLIIEVTGERKKDKEAKVAAARNLWIPAVNNHGGFGRCAFLEISDPWDAEPAIRSALRERCVDHEEG